MLPRNLLDRIRIVFDDHRLVANVGLFLPTTLARHPGLGELVDRHVDLGGVPGRADSGFYTHGVVSVCREMDVRYCITIRQHKSLHHLIEAIPEYAWTPLLYSMDGAADLAETTCTSFQSEPDAARVRLIVRRVKTVR